MKLFGGNKIRHILFVLVLASGLASVCMAAEGIWTTKADMPTAREVISSSVVDGKIYAIGGDPGSGCLPTVEAYNPMTDTWTRKANMPMGNGAAATSVVNGRIYVIGGRPSFRGAPYSSVIEYDALTDTWATKTDMPTARSWLSSSVVNEKIYVIGGAVIAYGAPLSTVEEYDPATDTWTRKADMPTARLCVCTSAVNGKIYAIGGSHGSQWYYGSTTVEEYDPETDTWTRKADMPTGRTYSSTCVVNGRIYAVGGVEWGSPDYVSQVEEYDPATDTWARMVDIPTARMGLTTSVVNGKIYAIGGWVSGGAVSTVEEYNIYTIFDDFNNAPVKNLTKGQGHLSIRGAINYADNGDEIVLVPGIYQERIDLSDRDIVLRSEDPNNPSVTESTIIQGNGQEPAVTFYLNHATCILRGLTITGGRTGLDLDGASPRIEYSRIMGNDDHGIRMQAKSDPVISHTLICTNSGAGIHMTGFLDVDFFLYNEPELINCTIAQNTEGGIQGGIVTMRNCIVSSNGTTQLSPVSAYVTYSCIQGGYSGEGNIDADPCFAQLAYWDTNDTPDDPNDDIWMAGDYHIKSQAGRFDPNSGDWVLDDMTSPCIDAGDPNSPLGSEPDPNGGRINIGAYGGTSQASTTP